MNHAERKALKRAEKKPAVYQMTADQITQLKKDACKEAADKCWEEYNERIRKIKKDATRLACESVVCLPMLVLHDKWGFGRDRLDRFLGYMDTWMKAINDDPATLEEIRKEVEAVTGYRFFERGDMGDDPKNTSRTEGTTPVGV